MSNEQRPAPYEWQFAHIGGESRCIGLVQGNRDIMIATGDGHSSWLDFAPTAKTMILRAVNERAGRASSIATFEQWLHREDYGDREQLRRCWDKSREAATSQPLPTDLSALDREALAQKVEHLQDQVAQAAEHFCELAKEHSAALDREQEVRNELARLKQEHAAEIDEFNAGFQTGIAGLDLETAEREYYDALTEATPRFDVFGVGYAWAVFEKMKAQLAAARAEDARLTAADNPDFDATDAASPAWWRGHDHTTKVFCALVNGILDGKDDGSGANCEPWASTRKRLLGLRQRLAEMEVKNGRLELNWTRATSSLETYDRIVTGAINLLYRATNSPHITPEDDAADVLACCWQEIRAKIVQREAEVNRLRAALAQVEKLTEQTIADADGMLILQLPESYNTYYIGRRQVAQRIAAIVASSAESSDDRAAFYACPRCGTDLRNEGRHMEKCGRDATTLTPEMIAWLDEHREDAIADGAEAFGEKFGIRGTAAGELIVQWLALRKGVVEGQERDDNPE